MNKKKELARLSMHNYYYQCDYISFDDEQTQIAISTTPEEIAEALGLIETCDVVHEEPYGYWNQPIRYHSWTEQVTLVEDEELEDWQPKRHHALAYMLKNIDRCEIEEV